MPTTYATVASAKASPTRPGWAAKLLNAANQGCSMKLDAMLRTPIDAACPACSASHWPSAASVCRRPSVQMTLPRQPRQQHQQARRQRGRPAEARMR